MHLKYDSLSKNLISSQNSLGVAPNSLQTDEEATSTTSKCGPLGFQGEKLALQTERQACQELEERTCGHC